METYRLLACGAVLVASTSILAPLATILELPARQEDFVAVLELAQDKLLIRTFISCTM